MWTCEWLGTLLIVAKLTCCWFVLSYASFLLHALWEVSKLPVDKGAILDAEFVDFAHRVVGFQPLMFEKSIL